jgi:hypothetical protein
MQEAWRKDTASPRAKAAEAPSADSPSLLFPPVKGGNNWFFIPGGEGEQDIFLAVEKEFRLIVSKV